MKKLVTLLAFLPLVGCSVGGVELTKEAVFCESGEETFSPGESVPAGDDCNFCICSAEGELENCSTNTCEGSVGMANPAAVKCSVDGLDYEIRKGADGGEYGVCIDAEDKVCEAWDYFRGDCELTAQESSGGDEAAVEDDTAEPEEEAVTDADTANTSEEAAADTEVTEPAADEETVADESGDTGAEEAAAETESATEESGT